ncbi:MAG: sugar phosphate nucleotidyltransferase [Candidatus Moranbacteria bacterium]|nr:sugar phosphate nucleotidyltransferase [Candidatus Moranbacteria bacterium]
MQCVILAAGRGTRMGELTKELPKPMIEVLGLPILAHKIDMLPASFHEVILVVGYRKEVITEYFGDEWNGRTITYVEQRELNGTAGAVHFVKDLVYDRFLVTMGDDIYATEDIEKLMQHPLALLGYYTQDAASFGLVTIDDANHLMGVVERPHRLGEGLVNTGAYILNTDFFSYPPVPISETEFGLPQTLVKMSLDYPVMVEVTTRWLPFGNPNDVALAERLLAAKQ